MRDDKKEYGSPIRSASLSVEDDGRVWIPHQVPDDKKECGSPIRSALLSFEDDKECVIPVKTGIQEGMDPQSEALRFRLRMTRGQSVEDDGREWIPHQVRDDTGQSKHRIIHKKQSEKCPTSSTKLPHLGDVGVWWK